MPQSLQVIAEVSIAFAGFSGLIVALRKRGGPLTDIQKLRLGVLLGLAFGALFLALLPELLQLLGMSSSGLWRTACMIALLYSVVFVTFWTRSSWRFRRSVPEIFDNYAFARMAAGHAVVVVLLLGVIASLLDQRAAGVYLAALIWYLIHAAQQFVRMLFIQPSGGLDG